MALPTDFAAVLVTLTLDYTFASEFPDTARRSLQLAEALDMHSCVVYHQLTQVCQSMNSSCQLLTAAQLLVISH